MLIYICLLFTGHFVSSLIRPNKVIELPNQVVPSSLYTHTTRLHLWRPDPGEGSYQRDYIIGGDFIIVSSCDHRYAVIQTRTVTVGFVFYSARVYALLTVPCVQQLIARLLTALVDPGPRIPWTPANSSSQRRGTIAPTAPL